jgi:citrate lyase subunit alpha/citrate CoA-transferase
MRERGIKGSFGLGGITEFFVDMMKEGLFERLLDVQSFDLAAVRSIGENPNHVEISADWYANPWNAGCAVNMLDTVVLGATEVDRDFNVNVNTEADGALLHGIGGHQDTAAGAQLTIITTPLLRGRIPCAVDSVYTVTTPGEVVDAIVTEFGVAINPRRQDLIDAAKEAGNVPLVTMDELIDKAHGFTGSMSPVETEERIIGVIEYRDGTVIDVVKQLKKK